MKKIAFLFLIYDCINHEHLWKAFFNNISTEKYGIYIHYKVNKPLEYFEQHKLQNCIETNYLDQTIPRAYNLLFRAAEKDPDNYKFVILSGACIPLKSFDHVYSKLTADDNGYFNVSPQSQCFPNCNSLLKVLPRKIIAKSHNWFILNRNLVSILCGIDKEVVLNTFYAKVLAPAEYYYYTFIKLYGLEDEIVITPNIAAGATTFANWSDLDYKYPSIRGLKNYSSISAEELDYLLSSDSLFGRKFNVECAQSIATEQYFGQLQVILGNMVFLSSSSLAPKQARKRFCALLGPDYVGSCDEKDSLSLSAACPPKAD